MTISIEGSATSVEDSQSVLTSIDQLLSLNGWVAALCPTLTRPFGQNTATDAYARLIEENHLYYIALHHSFCRTTRVWPVAKWHRHSLGPRAVASFLGAM